MKQSMKGRGGFAVLATSAAVVTIAALSIGTGVAQAPPAADRELMQARVGGSVAVETDIVTQLRRFEPGKRTYWHTHDGGFILFVHEGTARVQTRGELMRELKKGEVYYTPPGVEHWHGSAPNDALMQLGTVPFGGRVQFLEAVTDAQYNGQSK